MADLPAATGGPGWLLTSQGNWNLEFYGSRLLCYSPLLKVAQVEALMVTMRDLRDRIPSVLQDFAAAGGRLLPVLAMTAAL